MNYDFVHIQSSLHSLFAVISVMDHIWHMEGMDLRMTPYTCLATGHQVGVIQVVRNAKTVYQIQRKAGKLAAIQVDSTQLYKWIKSHNENNVDQALETFTRSCAGYCVATFILGIGDRHPDNIMVCEAAAVTSFASESNFSFFPGQQRRANISHRLRSLSRSLQEKVWH